MAWAVDKSAKLTPSQKDAGSFDGSVWYILELDMDHTGTYTAGGGAKASLAALAEGVTDVKPLHVEQGLGGYVYRAVYTNTGVAFEVYEQDAGGALAEVSGTVTITAHKSTWLVRRKLTFPALA